ncbi:hypothetical protein K3495_g8783 [Podosphaera aphanis]|nr:hypothetical protein K3495_g8783 [Podosphaera aphanis]
MGNHTIQASEEIRWLGILLDKSLNFRRHAAEWASKGVRLAQYLRRIASCTIGPLPGPMTTIVRTVILPTVLHGTEVWWPGRTRATNTGETRNSCGKQLAAIDNAIMAGIRAAIPTWRTMPTVALRRETGIPPAHVLLEEKRLANSARIRRLDINHPLRLRARESTEDARRRIGLRTSNRGWRTTDHIHDSRNQRTYWLLPESEDPPPLQWPGPSPPRLPHLDKERAARETTEWLAGLAADTLCAYSDGSLSSSAKAGWGFVTYPSGTSESPESHDSGTLSGAQVYDAEIHGAMAALKAIKASKRHLDRTTIYVLLDNLEAVHALQTGITISSAWRVQSFKHMTRQIAMSVKVRWVPGHQGIRGNETADQLAKAALEADTTPTTNSGLVTLASIKRMARDSSDQLTTEWWTSARTTRYAELELRMRRKKPPELALPRALYARLLAARTGHGDFAAYHRRWNHESATLACPCGRETSVGHLVECRRALANWRTISGRRRAPALHEMLGEGGWKTFAEYAIASGIYKNSSIGTTGIG